MKKTIVNLFFCLVVLPLSLGGILYYLNKNGFFNISEIEVILENPSKAQVDFLKPNVARLQIQLEEYKGLSLWGVKLKKISGEVSSLNWVEGLNIKRSWPSKLSIRIVPHEVKLLYLGKQGKLVPIIKDGTFLEPIEVRQVPDVAILEGENFQLKPELRKKAVEVIEQVPAEGMFSKKTISEIRYDSKEGFWMTLIKSGIRVKIGEDQIPVKSSRVSRVVDYLESRQLDARVIDANLSKKVLVRLRKDP